MKSPAFQFYPSDWLSSRAIRLMDAEQRGWYIQLLAEAWESEPQATLPNDEPLLRVLAGVNTCSTDVEQRWGLVRSQFKKRGSVIYNERQMEEVVRQEVNRQKKSEAGKASAEARRVEREVIKAQHLRDNKRTNKRSTPVENRSASVPTEGVTESNSSIPVPISTPPPDRKIVRPAKTPDERIRHPAIKAFYEVKGKYSNKDTWDLIIEKVGSHPDVPRMRECWLAWRSHNYNPEDLVWLLDWYMNGIPEHKKIGAKNGTAKGGYEPASERNVRNIRGSLEYLNSLSDDGGQNDSQDETRLLAAKPGRAGVSRSGGGVERSARQDDPF